MVDLFQRQYSILFFCYFYKTLQITVLGAEALKTAICTIEYYS